YAGLYYLIFSFCIARFDLATPGRGEAATGLSADWILPESQRRTKNAAPVRPANVGARASGEEDRDDVLARQVLAGLGGRENVQSVEGCITRLRLFVNDAGLIDDAYLKSLGASG